MATSASVHWALRVNIANTIRTNVGRIRVEMVPLVTIASMVTTVHVHLVSLEFIVKSTSTNAPRVRAPTEERVTIMSTDTSARVLVATTTRVV